MNVEMDPRMRKAVDEIFQHRYNVRIPQSSKTELLTLLTREQGQNEHEGKRTRDTRQTERLANRLRIEKRNVGVNLSFDEVALLQAKLRTSFRSPEELFRHGAIRVELAKGMDDAVERERPGVPPVSVPLQERQSPLQKVIKFIQKRIR